MDKFKKYSSNTILVLLFVFAAFTVIPWSAKEGSVKSYNEQLAQMNGKVIGFDGSLLYIEFDKPIIKDTGDTEINTFLVGVDGTNIQLDTITIPEKKAKELLNTKLLVFPIADKIPLLQPQVYAIEIFIKNSGSILHSKSIQLPLIPLDLSGATEETVKDVQV